MRNLRINDRPISKDTATAISLSTPSARIPSFHQRSSSRSPRSPGMRPYNRQCQSVSFAKYKDIIEKHCTITFNTDVLHKGDVIGRMFVDGLGNAKLKSKKCGPVTFTTCKSCQQIVKLLNRLKVKDRALQQTLTHIAPTEPSRSDTDDIAPRYHLTEDRVANPVCRWEACGCRVKFPTVRVLVDHIVEQIEVQSDRPPIERDYSCRWDGCPFRTKKKKSLEVHLSDKHTGSKDEEDRLLIIKDMIRNFGRCGAGRRWSFATIRVLINSMSAGVIDKARAAGLTLPSSSTIRAYKCYGRTGMGWNEATIKEMKEAMQTAGAPPVAGQGVISFDEVKVKEGLVFDPHTGNLIGATDHGELGTHVLQFFWSSAFFKFSYPIAYYITTNATAEDIRLYFWRGVGMLHRAGLSVMATIFDGSPQNTRFRDQILKAGSRHLAINCCVDGGDTNIIVLSDPPHLLKKLRNALYNSGMRTADDPDRYTRRMVLDGEHIVWDQIVHISQVTDCGCEIYGITNEAINLDSFSKMKVGLMEKVMNDRVAKGLKEAGFGSAGRYVETCAKLWELVKQRGQLIKPEDLEGFVKELRSVLQFFQRWEQQVYSSKEGMKADALPPFTTMRDIKTTIAGFEQMAISAMAMGEGLIPARLSQDVVESFFGHQRQACGSNRNMTAAVYGYNICNLASSKVAKSAYRQSVDVVAVARRSGPGGSKEKLVGAWKAIEE